MCIRDRSSVSPPIPLLPGRNVTSSLIDAKISSSVPMPSTPVSYTHLAGMNTLVSSTTTLKPPPNTCATLAVNTVWFSNASSNFLFPFSAARRLYERRTCPSPSFTLITFASMVSPADTTVVKSTFGSFVYSLRVIIPVSYTHLNTTLFTIAEPTAININFSICIYPPILLFYRYTLLTGCSLHSHLSDSLTELQAVCLLHPFWHGRYSCRQQGMIIQGMPPVP